MGCRQFGDNPLSEPMMLYWQLNHKEHISMKFYLQFKSFHSKNMYMKMSSAKMAAILSRPQSVKNNNHHNHIIISKASSSVSHYGDVIMDAIASQITSLAIVYSTVYSDADQRKHQSSASLAFVWGIHRGPVNSPHKEPVTRKMFPFDDVIMKLTTGRHCQHGDVKTSTKSFPRYWLSRVGPPVSDGAEQAIPKPMITQFTNTHMHSWVSMGYFVPLWR